MQAELRAVIEGDRVVDLALAPPLGAKVVDSAHGPVLYVVTLRHPCWRMTICSWTSGSRPVAGSPFGR